MSDTADTLATYPHALGAEKSVLSVLLREPQMIDELPGITSAHFHIPAHRDIFEIIREMTLAGQAVNSWRSSKPYMIAASWRIKTNAEC